ncbi:MAG TPA: MbtH family NRPS accessory protein [Steroidobacteraceae bacterium]|nr:MbtH family NRPS accessory protein [Steroidobacteraceae bacterium]
MFDDENTQFRVVYNHEEQYSIWPVVRDIPLGWKEEGKVGNKQECLDHIEKVWVDMRPLSLRKHLEAMQRPN